MQKGTFHGSAKIISGLCTILTGEHPVAFLYTTKTKGLLLYIPSSGYLSCNFNIKECACQEMLTTIGSKQLSYSKSHVKGTYVAIIEELA